MKDYMKDIIVGYAIKAGRTDTICWDCKKLCMVGAAGLIRRFRNR